MSSVYLSVKSLQNENLHFFMILLNLPSIPMHFEQQVVCSSTSCNQDNEILTVKWVFSVNSTVWHCVVSVCFEFKLLCFLIHQLIFIKLATHVYIFILQNPVVFAINPPRNRGAGGNMWWVRIVKNHQSLCIVSN